MKRKKGRRKQRGGVTWVSKLAALPWGRSGQWAAVEGRGQVEKGTWRAHRCSNCTAGCNRPRRKKKRRGEEEGSGRKVGNNKEKQLSVSISTGGWRFFMVSLNSDEENVTSTTEDLLMRMICWCKEHQKMSHTGSNCKLLPWQQRPVWIRTWEKVPHENS